MEELEEKGDDGLIDQLRLPLDRRSMMRRTTALGTGAGLFSGISTGASKRSRSAGKRPADPAIANDVRREFLRAWKEYKEHAFGHDRLKPLSETYDEFFLEDESLGLTIIESLDTMYLMGLDEELSIAVEWIEENLTFDYDQEIQVFEATIRLVGGLIAGYKATENETLLDLAQDLADRLLPAFEKSPTGMPYRFVNLRTGEVSSGFFDNPENFMAEIGTHIVEWGELSELVGDDKYYNAAKNALQAAYERRSNLDLLGATINVETGEWTDTLARIGPPVDSFYEYLWDGWALFGDSDLLEWYSVLLDGIFDHQAEWYNDYLWFKRVDMNTGELGDRQQSELSQFFAGLLVESGQPDLGGAYHDSWTQVHEKFGLPPGQINYSDLSAVWPSWYLRPEYLGPALLLYDETGDEVYRDRAYRHYQQMKTHSQVENGYTVIEDVTTRPMERGDLTMGYWFSENMKYFYLLFAEPDRLDRDNYYLTTEGNVVRGLQ
ncbi:glycoside hydrolase family 47 protein [Haladaptatus halobius]|uniref:glycoside hydrolase family 47 protein n=1 Tax=Haladaptatus halobius TaxID=2884875 RepID=UPI001D0B643F|nr:glycoside hydrolase family 47 protein [Haladaptatus halobius]